LLPQQKSEPGIERNKFNDGGEVTLQQSPPKAPKKSVKGSGFNPDPGGVTPDPKWDWTPDGMPSSALSSTTAGALGGSLFPESNYPDSEAEPLLPSRLRLPRHDVQDVTPIRRTWEYPDYYEHTQGYGRWNNTEPMPQRWEITPPHWQRYMDPSHETP